MDIRAIYRNFDAVIRHVKGGNPGYKTSGSNDLAFFGHQIKILNGCQTRHKFTSPQNLHT
jgi:hypothetical protein